MATEAAMRTFFSSPTFAVVGASSDPAKFGNKIFAWYTSHSLPVTPINPTSPTITLNKQAYPALSSLTALPSPTTTSVSIVTPPAITKKVLAEAKELGIPAVWLQPGTYDTEGLEFALSKDNFKAGLGGFGGGTRGHEGWCVLVDGGRGLGAVGKL